MIAENPRSSIVETCLCPPGRSMAYDFQTKENGSRAEKTRPALDTEGRRYDKMDGPTSVDRFQADFNWEMSDKLIQG